MEWKGRVRTDSEVESEVDSAPVKAKAGLCQACRHQSDKHALTTVSRSGEVYMQPTGEHAFDIILDLGLSIVGSLLSAWCCICSVPGTWSSS